MPDDDQQIEEKEALPETEESSSANLDPFDLRPVRVLLQSSSRPRTQSLHSEQQALHHLRKQHDVSLSNDRLSVVEIRDH